MANTTNKITEAVGLQESLATFLARPALGGTFADILPFEKPNRATPSIGAVKAGAVPAEVYNLFEDLLLDYIERIPGMFANTVSLAKYGVNGDGNTDNYTAFMAAVNATAVSGGVLRIPKGVFYVVKPGGGDITIPANVILSFDRHYSYSMIKPANGTRIILQSTPDAAREQPIFDALGPAGYSQGTVTFSSSIRCPSEVPAEWYGATSSEASDALLCAYNGCQSGAWVTLGAGTWNCAKKIGNKINGSFVDKAWKLRGAGHIGASSLRFGLSSAQNAIELDDITSYAALQGFHLDTSNGNCQWLLKSDGIAHLIIESVRVSPANAVTGGIWLASNSYDMHFRDVLCLAQSTTAHLPIGVQVDRGGNVSLDRGCMFSGCRDFGVVAGSATEQVARFVCDAAFEAFGGSAAGYPGDAGTRLLWLRNTQQHRVNMHGLAAGDSAPAAATQRHIMLGRCDGGFIEGFFDGAGQVLSAIEIMGSPTNDTAVGAECANVTIGPCVFWASDNSGGAKNVIAAAGATPKACRVIPSMRATVAGGSTGADTVARTLANSATPSVGLDSGCFVTAAANTFTNFPDGYIGQILNIRAAHAAVLDNSSADIETNTGANVTMVVGRMYQLIKGDDGVWRQPG